MDGGCSFFDLSQSNDPAGGPPPYGEAFLYNARIHISDVKWGHFAGFQFPREVLIFGVSALSILILKEFPYLNICALLVMTTAVYTKMNHLRLLNPTIRLFFPNQLLFRLICFFFFLLIRFFFTNHILFLLIRLFFDQSASCCSLTRSFFD